MQLNAACACCTGKIRTNNEDNFFFDGIYLEEENNGIQDVLSAKKKFPNAGCYAVFDGMGGEAFGEKAAYLAAKTLAEYVTLKNFQTNEKGFIDISMKMNSEVCKEAEKRDFIRMGSTTAIISFYGNKASICNLGDSKIFLFRNGILSQISKNHTDEMLLKKQGIRNRKPRLKQHLGIHPSEMIIEPYCKEFEVFAKDKYLLCSDGLTDMLDAKQIHEILEKNENVKQTTKILLETALREGGRDNITIILLEVVL